MVTVVSPTADLALGLFDAPDPLLLGNYLTYTITVSNGGPATATGVIAVDTLPPAVNFISASPTNSYTVVGQVVTFTNLGNLASGAQTNVTITVQPTTAGTITDTASCHSGVIDPFKANNSASVKTIVQLVPLTVSQQGQNLVISWPANAGELHPGEHDEFGAAGGLDAGDGCRAGAGRRADDGRRAHRARQPVLPVALDLGANAAAERFTRRGQCNCRLADKPVELQPGKRR